MVQTEFSIRIISTSDSLGLKNWFGYVRIQGLELNRIDFQLIHNEIENFFRISIQNQRYGLFSEKPKNTEFLIQCKSGN